ncbi:hypothetical protein H5410_002840, partial [Solanum commersonii]
RSNFVFEKGPFVLSGSNWPRSIIFSINGDDCVEDVTDILGCEVDKFPTIYLGLLLRAKRKDKSSGKWFGLGTSIVELKRNWIPLEDSFYKMERQMKGELRIEVAGGYWR